jgi:hypothetical protein
VVGNLTAYFSWIEDILWVKNIAVNDTRQKLNIITSTGEILYQPMEKKH